jgi:hypothetical protein
MSVKFIYKTKDPKKLRNDFNRRKREGKNKFIDFNAYKKWYENQSKECYYCHIEEEVCQEIVKKGILKSGRFPINGVPERGKARGLWLEVDRLKPKESYSEVNCVLACYFCNNDKSDIFHGDEYKEFFQNRKKYLKNLLK